MCAVQNFLIHVIDDTFVLYADLPLTSPMFRCCRALSHKHEHLFPQNTKHSYHGGGTPPPPPHIYYCAFTRVSKYICRRSLLAQSSACIDFKFNMCVILYMALVDTISRCKNGSKPFFFAYIIVVAFAQQLISTPIATYKSKLNKIDCMQFTIELRELATDALLLLRFEWRCYLTVNSTLQCTA